MEIIMEMKNVMAECLKDNNLSQPPPFPPPTQSHLHMKFSYQML